MTLEQVGRRGSGWPDRPRMARTAVWAASAAAWAGLTRREDSGSGGAAYDMAGMGSMVVDPWTPAWVGTWLLMVAAMMWPLADPHWPPFVGRPSAAGASGWSRRVSHGHGPVGRGRSRRRRGAQLGAVPARQRPWQVSWLAVAALVTRSTRRARVLWRCGKLPPVAPGGLRGVCHGPIAGVAAWRRCAVLCGPLMTAMVVGHDPVLMVSASLAAWWEAAHPRAWRDPVPVLLLVVGGAWLLLVNVVLGGWQLGRGTLSATAPRRPASRTRRRCRCSGLCAGRSRRHR